mgnify:CR=1 FL=1
MNVLPPGHPPFKVGKVGVLLINLGTPEGTDYWPMRRYLKEFLSDRRVIEVNPVLWWVLLNGRAAEHLYRGGNLAGDLPFAQLKERAYINPVANTLGDTVEFSEKIREGRPGSSGP